MAFGTGAGIAKSTFFVEFPLFQRLAAAGESQTQNPKPKTPNPKPKTQNPKPKTQNPKPKNPKPEIQNPSSKTQNPKSYILSGPQQLEIQKIREALEMAFGKGAGTAKSTILVLWWGPSNSKASCKFDGPGGRKLATSTF